MSEEKCEEMKKTLAFQEISSAVAAELAAQGWMVIWPVASLEQHGPHLPLGTDALILDALVDGCREELGEAFPGVFLPVLNYGKSPEHLNFAGTVSLQSTTLLAAANDLVASLVRHGFRNFVFFNGHGGNTALLQSAAFDLRQQYDVQVYNIDLWGGGFFRTIVAEHFPSLTNKEVHAASLETSLMQYLHPDLVGPIPAVEISPRLGRGIPLGWLAEDFHPSGVIGDPSLADAGKGAKIYRDAVTRASRLLRDLESQISNPT
jgi:creatinine amidohydrolase